MEALRVESLSKNFGGVRALQNVSFSVGVGERLAIIGPNGAGKTTLFNVLNGQLSATSGRIYFSRQEITTMPTRRRAYLGQARSFQINRLFSNLTVLRNILIAIHGTKPSHFQMFRSTTAYKDVMTKAEELLGGMGLWEKRDLPITDLSYGEQRKMEIALSLASEPRLLLLDEPQTGLTPAEIADLTKMIRNLGANITVLVIAHDLDLVFDIADRILVLHYGEVIAIGTSEEIKNDLRVKEVYMGIEEGTGSARVG